MTGDSKIEQDRPADQTVSPEGFLDPLFKTSHFTAAQAFPAQAVEVTIQEAREALAVRLGVPVESINITVS